MSALAAVVALGAILAGLEAMAPLRPQPTWGRRHRRPNIALSAATFALAAGLDAVLALLLVAQYQAGIGLLHAVAAPPLLAGALAVVTLDLATYLAHVTLHASPALWRLHRVHHADPAVDVTTAFRQHPGEGAVRFLFVVAGACALGAAPGAVAAYRALSALNALLEHSNVRVPPRLDAWVVWLLVTPDMHKVHHSRCREETNSNYGNILSLFDRCFATFTPSARGRSVSYGLDGLDDPRMHTTTALLALPFRDGPPRPSNAALVCKSGRWAIHDAAERRHAPQGFDPLASSANRPHRRPAPASPE